ncbi:hypothetical protein BGP77_12510 [Saccharospirillum sp. MSK14-1]|uniref:hypothetical protein n=1 Tax=Saccharospirillum sp. MSK14-1 TaxID=1897632 RepID=UPI000D386D8E|nr:hypothetical protein [Saccharospirillum sp. MSK14-1]PTY38520.1 hypothetical protein BGP77_12510 [Saccharospirillum sp. MSK14-1]
MKVLSLRYCTISQESEALFQFYQALGLTPKTDSESDAQQGGIFLAGDSWIEVWPDGEGMPAGTMLQLVVDDADAFAARAKEQGLNPQGPMEAHGEKIYFVEGPGGFPVSFQSTVSGH